MKPNRPFKLSSLRVERTYRGGRLLDEWQKKPLPEDCNKPEWWIASTVTAYNPKVREGEPEGLAFLPGEKGEKVYLKDLIHEDPVGYLGADHSAKFGESPGFLTKVLDTSERLVIQVHPDKDSAKRIFHSEYGKTEAWYVLGGRRIEGGEPYVLLGFKPGITKEIWREIFDSQDIPRMVNALHKIPVAPGTMLMVESGTPHAIGPGCFILEIQEPTDFTLRTERRSPSGLDVPDSLCHQGAGFDKIFDCFHYEGLGEAELRRRCVLAPGILRQGNAFVEEALIGPDFSELFGLEKLVLFGAGRLEIASNGTFSVLVITQGSGMLRWKEDSMQVFQGEQIFLPAGTSEVLAENIGPGQVFEIVRCVPPRQVLPQTGA